MQQQLISTKTTTITATKRWYDSTTTRTFSSNDNDDNETAEKHSHQNKATTTTAANEDDKKGKAKKGYFDGDGHDDPVDGKVDAITSITSNTTKRQQQQRRKELLQQQLQLLEIDAAELDRAVIQSMENPILGYDGRYGKSAIRTYKSFLFPKTKTDDDVEDVNDSQLMGMAFRAAHQVHFLLKRHEAHRLEWIRHGDDASQNKTTTTITTNNNDNSAIPTKESHLSSQRRNDSNFPRMILILDNLRSALNVGNLFRTAEATGCQAIWTVGITPYPQGNGAHKLEKSALGADRIVPSQHFYTLQQAIAALKRHNDNVNNNNKNNNKKNPDMPPRSANQQDPNPVLQQSPRNTGETTTTTSREDGDLQIVYHPNDGSSTAVQTTLQHDLPYQLVALETTEQSVDYTTVQYNQFATPMSITTSATTGTNNQMEEKDRASTGGVESGDESNDSDPPPNDNHNDTVVSNSSNTATATTTTTTPCGIALVLGSEVTGVTPSLLAEMDVLVQIPTFGMKNSLNVAACAPIVLYEIIRQWKTQRTEKQETNNNNNHNKK